jgi:hypothetical protein
MTPERSGYGTDRMDDADLRMIAARIIMQAVDDWLFLIKLEDREKKGENPTSLRGFRNRKLATANFGEIRGFLRSQWGETLCGMIDLDAAVVLEKLEKWLDDYRTTGTMVRQTFWENPCGKGKRPDV